MTSTIYDLSLLLNCNLIFLMSCYYLKTVTFRNNTIFSFFQRLFHLVSEAEKDTELIQCIICEENTLLFSCSFKQACSFLHFQSYLQFNSSPLQPIESLLASMFKLAFLINYVAVACLLLYQFS